MEDCIFCKIVAGEVPCAKVFENDKILAFRDIQPQAKVHVLIVPKRHVADIVELAGLRNGLMANIAEAAAQIAHAEGVDKSGFRLVTNCGPDAQQTVGHLHFHLMGGEKLSERMA
ncbi:MAG: histidine triad nucleotide-binding protein [Clostridiales bacterium]|nr:histidine triad nucleotide-binding protein [Clostridiales bacterium]